MKSLKEIQKSIREGSSVKTFSKSNFDDIAIALLNEVDHETTVVKTKKGEIVKEKIQPVKTLRNKVVKEILIKAGLDKHDAEAFANNYKFTNVEGLYEFVSELLTSYLDTGKKFNFLTKEDFRGSLVMNDVDKTVKERRIIRPNDPSAPAEVAKIQTEAHREIRVKGASAPAWLKKKLK